jgi:hypothetical protein
MHTHSHTPCRRRRRRRVTQGGGFSRIHPTVTCLRAADHDGACVRCHIHCQDAEAADDVLVCLELRRNDADFGAEPFANACASSSMSWCRYWCVAVAVGISLGGVCVVKVGVSASEAVDTAYVRCCDDFPCMPAHGTGNGAKLRHLGLRFRRVRVCRACSCDFFGCHPLAC